MGACGGLSESFCGASGAVAAGWWGAAAGEHEAGGSDRLADVGQRAGCADDGAHGDCRREAPQVLEGQLAQRGGGEAARDDGERDQGERCGASEGQCDDQAAQDDHRHGRCDGADDSGGDQVAGAGFRQLGGVCGVLACQPFGRRRGHQAREGAIDRCQQGADRIERGLGLIVLRVNGKLQCAVLCGRGYLGLIAGRAAYGAFDAGVRAQPYGVGVDHNVAVDGSVDDGVFGADVERVAFAGEACIAGGDGHRLRRGVAHRGIFCSKGDAVRHIGAPDGDVLGCCADAARYGA